MSKLCSRHDFFLLKLCSIGITKWNKFFWGCIHPIFIFRD